MLSFGLCLRTNNLKTVWVPGATFYYEPMWTWQMLLGQRRRWINGTVAAYIFWLVQGEGAVEFAMSGMSNGRIVQLMWAMQLYQLAIVSVSPSFFGMALYEAVAHLTLNWFKQLMTHPGQVSWLRTPICIAMLYYFVYVLWVIVAYFFGAYPKWFVSLCFREEKKVTRTLPVEVPMSSQRRLQLGNHRDGAGHGAGHGAGRGASHGAGTGITRAGGSETELPRTGAPLTEPLLGTHGDHGASAPDWHARSAPTSQQVVSEVEMKGRVLISSDAYKLIMNIIYQLFVIVNIAVSGVILFAMVHSVIDPLGSLPGKWTKEPGDHGATERVAGTTMSPVLLAVILGSGLPLLLAVMLSCTSALRYVQYLLPFLLQLPQ